MGANSRRRREAKRREAPRPPRDPTPPRGSVEVKPLLARAVVVVSVSTDEAVVARLQAQHVLTAVNGVPAGEVGRVADDLLLDLVAEAAQGAWGPGDLGELVGRHAGAGALPTLARSLREHARRDATTRAAWSGELDSLIVSLARAQAPVPHTLEGLAIVLRVAALLGAVPPLRVSAASASPVRHTSTSAAHPKLARVRALLAKAESTEYDEEAEALSAKAQELISRYALERLLDDETASGPAGATARRLWLDAPYVGAKAGLVHAVAHANRCRSAVSESLGFCVVVGDPHDVDAVELLVTSLLVQATTAMQRHGRRVDRRGVSRTRSFRRSFLLAYASRVGDRLRSAADQVVRDAGDEGRLLPVLRDHGERIAEAFDAMVPHTASARRTSISNAEGWAAGRAAADRAVLDVRSPIGPGR